LARLSSRFSAPCYFTQFAAADLFLDGANDLVMARPGRPGANQGKVSYFDGDAAGVATTNFNVITGGSSGLALGSNAGSFAVGDIDQDGFDDLVIGVPGFSSANGKVMVFRGGSTMSGIPNLTITGSGNDSFGKGVAIARVRGNTSPPSIIVGEPEFDSPTLNVGRILVFHAPPGGLPTATTSAGADDTIVHNVSSSNFGAAVAKCGNLVDGNGDCVAVGAPQKAGSGGDVFVFGALSNGTGLNHTVAGTASGTASGCSAGLFGNHVAAAGNVENVTGDGGNRVDLLVGSPLCSNGNNSEGKAFLYTGVSGGALSPSTWTFEVNQDGASVGPIAGLGDVTGDGVADFAVGAPEMDNIAVTITNINDSGTGGTVIVTAPGHGITTVGQVIGVHNANIGGATYNKDYTVAQIIDANNVRTAEVDPGSDNDPAVTSGTVFTVAGAGRVYVFKGKSSGTPSTTQTVSMSTSFSGNCGTSIAGGVDFNRDGFMDMIEGEPLFDNGTTNQGRVRIFFGKPGTMDSNPASTFNGGAANRLMGSLVAAGNLDGKADGSTSNGDVYGDVIIGLPGFTGSFNGEGEVLVRVGRW
jgi:FG-GAP repeat